MRWFILVLAFQLSELVAAIRESDLTNPCLSSKCEKISTQLMSKHQYSVSRHRKYHISDHQDTQDGFWIRYLRKRRRKKFQQQQRDSRVKRSPTRTIVSVNTEYKTFKKNKKCHKYAMFKVFREDFTLCLMLGDFLDDPILSDRPDLTLSIYGDKQEFRTSRLSSMHLQIAEGHVLGQVFSSVRGYVWRDKFYGTVFTERETLHIEPLLNVGPVNTRYVRGVVRPVNAYVYRVFSRHRKRHRSKPRRSVNRRRHIRAYRRQRRSQRWRKLKLWKWLVKQRSEKREGRNCQSCGLLLIADQTFYKEVGERSVKGSVLQMLYHARELNTFMMRQDYDQDGRSDCVGVHVAGLGVIKSKSSYNNILDTNTSSVSPQSYLKTFSQYQLDGYCLAILFSSRQFPGKVLGLSWRADNVTNAGICQSRSNVASPASPEMLNLNSLFITMRTKHMARIPLRMGVLNLAHEVHHSLGAQHDPEGGECGGRFLMSRYSGSGTHPDNEKISVCTARSVRAVLERQGDCLVKRPSGSHCGDGRVERGEECDCGDQEACAQSRSLCVPPGLRRGELQCSLRQNRDKLSECSRFGLSSCSRGCPQARSNSIHCNTCCQDTSGICRPVEDWAVSLFDEMQHYLARLCWASTVSACMRGQPRYQDLLSRLSHSSNTSSQTSRVFCLKTGYDSNCWQIPFSCDE